MAQSRSNYYAAAHHRAIYKSTIYKSAIYLRTINHATSHQSASHPTNIGHSHKRVIEVIFILFVVSLLCVGCSSSSKVQTVPLPSNLILNDTAFPRYKDYTIERSEQIFALNDDAKIFVKQSMLGLRSAKEKAQNLASRIFDRTELDLTYEASANTIANDTFKSASANCLSLSIMTYAMATEAGFQSQFQIVHIPEYWTRQDGYTLLNSHVNLKITPRAQAGTQRLYETGFVVDFDPQTRSKKFPTNSTNENVVLAMFYNNKGADALLNDNHDKAYAYFRSAILIAENYAGTWVNLGFLYRKTQQYELAKKSYQQAIAIDGNYNTAWENLAILYARMGDIKAASEIEQRLKATRSSNPFYHQMLAEIDRDNGSFENSIDHYQKAIRLDNNQHQFYFGLASVYFQKGDFDRSERYLKMARRKAGRGSIADTYVNKLSALSSYIDYVEDKKNQP